MASRGPIHGKGSPSLIALEMIINLYESFLPYVLRSLENGLLLVAHDRKLLLCDSKNSTWKNITNYKQVEYYQKEASLYIETLVSPYRR